MLKTSSTLIQADVAFTVTAVEVGVVFCVKIVVDTINVATIPPMPKSLLC